MYPISIYEVDTGKPWAFGDFLGHHEIVYTLRWLKGDKMLASASGDGTVKLWNIPSSAWESPSKSKKIMQKAMVTMMMKMPTAG